MTLCQTQVKVKEQTHPRRGVINHTQTGEVEFLHKHISCVRGEAGRRLANPISHGFRLRLKAEAASYCQHTQTNQGQGEGGSLRAIHGAQQYMTSQICTGLDLSWFVDTTRSPSFQVNNILWDITHPFSGLPFYAAAYVNKAVCVTPLWLGRERRKIWLNLLCEFSRASHCCWCLFRQRLLKIRFGISRRPAPV